MPYTKTAKVRETRRARAEVIQNEFKQKYPTTEAKLNRPGLVGEKEKSKLLARLEAEKLTTVPEAIDENTNKLKPMTPEEKVAKKKAKAKERAEAKKTNK